MTNLFTYILSIFAFLHPQDKETTMKFPENIKNIGITSLSGIPNKERLGVGSERLKALGLNPIQATVQAEPKRYLAAPDEERIRQFHELLANQDIDAIIMACGGYGSSRIVNSLNWELIRSRNIPIVGYSDVSGLHLAALKHGCRNHVHGPMVSAGIGAKLDTPERKAAYEKTMQSLCNVLSGEKNLLPADAKLTVMKAGKSTGPLVPTNLSLLHDLIGTPSMPDLSGAILAIEDVNEPAYKIDRYLTKLKVSGHLGRLRGLIYGAFTDTDDVEFLPDVLAEFAAQINGPVVSGLEFGHVFPTLSLPVGKEVVLDATTDTPTLTLAPISDYESCIYQAKGFTLGYRFLSPKTIETDKKYPLVVFLHGAGERGMDNHVQLVHVLPKFVQDDIREKFPCFVAAPQCPDGQQWVNTPWGLRQHDMPQMMSDSLAAVSGLIDDLLLDYPIDASRIYVMGISMGGYGTWDLVMRFPKRFAAAVPICGGADIKQAALIKDLPLWVFHGDSDTAVPTYRSQSMVAALKEAGGDPKYTEFPNCGHNAWGPAIETPELLPWLFSQRLK